MALIPRNCACLFAGRCAAALRSSALLRACAAGVVCFLGLIAVFQRDLAAYYPSDDEMSLIVNSTPLTDHFQSQEWITRGYSTYCCPYPEWSRPRFNFIRPVGNVCYYLNWQLWGRSWGRYLYLNWLVLAVGAAMACYMADALLGCKWWLAATAAVLMATSPGNPTALTHPNLGTDPLCGVFAGAAFLAVMGKRNVLAAVALTLALFSKEIIVWGPFAAAATVMLGSADRERRPWRERIPVCALFFAPLAGFALARHFAFGSLIGGAQPAPSLEFKKLALGLCYTVLNWPLGLAGTTFDPCPTIRALVLRNWGEVSWLAAAAGAFNLCLVAWALASGGRWLSANGLRRGTTAVAALLIWIAPWIIVLPLLGMGIRHGYILYLFGLPLMAYGMSRAIDSRNVARGLGIALAVSLGLGLHLFAVDRHCRGFYDDFAGFSRSLVDTVREAGKRFETVYVVNDVGVYTSCQFLGRFAGASAPVVVLNSTCSPAAAPASNAASRPTPALDIEPQSDGLTTISVDVGDDGCLLFPCVSFDLMFPDIGVSRAVRNPRIRYEFPELSRMTGVSGKSGLSLGRKMVVKLSDRSNYGIVYLDAEARAYRIAAKNEAVHLPVELLRRERPGVKALPALLP